ncbi:MAG: DUF3887 domain-containing protein [Eubacteriales bacterium]|nr:DUF3887 domain-containing protein [Eubacteriales bacterium]
MKKIFKGFPSLLVLVLTICALGGCSSKNKLADCFNEKDVKTQAMEDITLAESDNFEGWQARFAPEYQSVVTEDAYISYKEVLARYGAFQEFGKAAVIGQEKDGKNCAVAVIICKHKGGDVKYTAAYDENMNLIQFTI